MFMLSVAEYVSGIVYLMVEYMFGGTRDIGVIVLIHVGGEDGFTG